MNQDMPLSLPRPKRITGLEQVASQYKAVLSDVWGVVHNGRSVYRHSVEALAAFRKQGGRVVLITNSPRPHGGVRQQLDELNVDPETYDDIVTSGDVTRDLISKVDGSVFHLGPARDTPLFAGLDTMLSSADEATAVVCTGLFEDEQETPEDYRDMLAGFAERRLPFICANPDIVVERGDRLIWCAGSLAQLYEQLGGETLLAGKPHQPIYELAFEKLQHLSNGRVDKVGTLAIGDGMPTDVAGAQANDFDLLYISAGIHSAEYGDPDAPDVTALEAFLDEHGARPKFWSPRLSWTGA